MSSSSETPGAPALEAGSAHVELSLGRMRSAAEVGLRSLPVQPSAVVPGRRPERARRAFNFSAALLGLIVSLPLCLLIALAVAWTSPGPVLFTQLRVGIDRRSGRDRRRDGRAGRSSLDGGRRWADCGGRLFTIYKFRTMRVERVPAFEVWATPDDPRVTRLGKLLRKYRLDELPQLVNVLKGDMNLVGPRPEQPRIFVGLREEIDRYPERQRVRPGITGLAQIRQPYDRSVDDVRRKLLLDLEYVNRCSVLDDLAIMLRTIPVVLFRRGAW